MSTTSGLLAFILYFVSALGILGLFMAIYVWFTPYAEIELIREGNSAAAISFGGALIGFVLPLSSVIFYTHSLLEMALWGAITGSVQLLVFMFGRLIIPNVQEQVQSNVSAAAILLCALSVGVGILNAICISY